MVKRINAEKKEVAIALWELEIQEVEGKSLEKKGREEVNEMLSNGWVILSVYTLRYKGDDDTWLERPMVILGLPKNPIKTKKSAKKEFPKSAIL